MAKIEAMLTPEQVLSDTVARKRRKFTKKRSTSLTRRELTPVRHLEDKTTTTSDEDTSDRIPKTPERRRPRRNKSEGKRNVSETDSETGKVNLDRLLTPNDESISVSRSSSFGKARSNGKFVEERKQRESLTDLAQAEVLAFLSKTKRSITAAAQRGRDRFRKNGKELVKRSQSAPHQFTEEELIESFNKAQLLSATDYKPRTYSDSSLQSVTPEIPFEPKPFRPEVEQFVRQRKRQREYSTKIIEILDPQTSEVVATKAMVRPEFKLRNFFSNLRMFSLLEICRTYKSYKLENKEECLRLRVLWNRCMFELFFIMMFCGMGGMLFKFTEGSFENYYKCGVKRVKRDFIDLLWMKSHNMREEDWKSLARNRLRVFEEELHTAHEAGMTSYSGQRSWSFLNGVVYALTIVTTIGYGHLYPTTTTGQALTIVYSIIGIPLFLIALTDFGKLFTRGIKFLWSFVRRLYYTGSCRHVRKTAQVQEIFKGAQMMYNIATFRRSSIFIDPENPENPVRPRKSTLKPKSAASRFGPSFFRRKTVAPPVPTTPQTAASSHVPGEDTPVTPAISNFEINDEFNLPISVALFILITYIFIGAVLYCFWEGWNFFSSFYFVFISMSTIGFGDMVPKDPICMIVSIVYLVFGLALMSMCINVVQEKLSDTFKQASAKLGATIGFEVDEGAVSAAKRVEQPGVHNPSPSTKSADKPFKFDVVTEADRKKTDSDKKTKKDDSKGKDDKAGKSTEPKEKDDKAGKSTQPKEKDDKAGNSPGKNS